MLVVHDDRWNKIWTQSRNPIRVGRIIRSILNTAKVEYTDKEIEDFVNLYKSTYDIMNDAFLKFDVVKGDDISYWYNHENYESMDSTLGSSCMAEVDSSFFDIYVKNPDVCSLVILYSDNGSLRDNKWKSNKIKGRALLWKTDQGDMFMDRIYYNNDSDVTLFQQYSDRNNWYHKKNQNSEYEFTAIRGNESKKPKYTISLSESEFKSYPYVDTLTYLNFSTKKLSNYSREIDADAHLDSTGGYYDSI